MRNSLGLFVVCLAMCLSSCVGEAPSSSMPFSAPEVGSSERIPSSAAASSAKPSVQASSSSEKSSSEKPSPSSSAAVYYTVSIYQSYYIEKERRYGNPRFDTSVTREEGEYIFNTVEEMQELEMLCCPFFPHSGGLYALAGFYIDQECTKQIPFGVKVDSDLRIYYYCF